MKTPLSLSILGTSQVVAFACGECGVVHKDVRSAESCCAPRFCKGCGIVVRRYVIRCDVCSNASLSERTAAELSKAVRVSQADYADPVYNPTTDKYHSTYEEFLEEWEDENDGDPPLVFACDREGLSLDADQIVQNALEVGEHHEDACGQISDAHMQELREFLTQWAKDSGVESWSPRRTAVVVRASPSPPDDPARRPSR